ncbi:MAG: MATE family efflux transporter [Sandaracinaceae bacterium]
MPAPLSERTTASDILALALPALGSLAADPLVSLVDTMFVGRIDGTALGALGVCSAVFGLAFFVFNFLSTGVTPLVASAVGRGDRDEAGRWIMQALTLAVILGLLATAALEGLTEPILSGMGARGALWAPSETYLRIRALATPAVLLITVGHGAFRGHQNTRTPFWLTLGLNVVNLVLDPLLIFGLGWGIAGAAWATTIAQWVGAVGFLAAVFAPSGLGVRFAIPKLRDLAPLLKVGSALSLRTFALVSTFTLATAVATRIGERAVAAHQVVAQIWLFLALVVDSVAIAGQALVGRLLGQGERTEARRVADRLLRWGLVLGLVLGAVFWALGPILPGWFTDEAAILRDVDTVYIFVIVSQPIGALVFVWDGLFMGAQDFRFLAAQMLLSAAAGAAVLLSVIPMGWGLTGVWWGMIALLSARLLTLGWRYWLGGGPLAKGRAPGGD